MTEIFPAHFRRHRFPVEIIAHAVWLYYRFPLSFRDVEDLLAERGIEVSFQTVSEWAAKFKPPPNVTLVMFAGVKKSLAYRVLSAAMPNAHIKTPSDRNGSAFCSTCDLPIKVCRNLPCSVTDDLSGKPLHHA